jgi:hypothetical protein
MFDIGAFPPPARRLQDTDRYAARRRSPFVKFSPLTHKVSILSHLIINPAFHSRSNFSCPHRFTEQRGAMSESLNNLIKMVGKISYPASFFISAFVMVLLSVMQLIRWIWSPSKRHNLPIFPVTSPDVIGVLEDAYKKVCSHAFRLRRWRSFTNGS